MQPEESLATIERTVRKAIRLMLPDWQNVVSSSDAGRAARAAANEAANRQGVTVSADVLDYLYTGPAFALVLDNYEAFEPMLGDRARTASLLALIEDVRNTVAHGRELVTYERDLIAGVAGYLTNLVALWETRSANVAANYPVITSARDSFGRDGIAYEFATANLIRIDVGQTVEFTAQATEARGQGVLWIAGVMSDKFNLQRSMSSIFRGRGPEQWSARGARARFRVTFTERDVGEMQRLWVAITSKSKHHRHGVMDDFRVFPFAVNPPIDA